MANRLIIEEQNGNVGVSLHWEGHLDPERVGGSITFETPLEPQEMEELRWYLEDYLTAPYAVWEEKGSRIQEILPNWGERLFECVFGSGKPGRDAYLQARGKGDFHIWLRSDSPDFLGLPWELLKDPEHPTPIALGLAGLNRTIPVQAPAAEVGTGDTLRVLMVIARPYGTRDIPYQMIARPLMERLELLSAKVQIEVVRPPTIDELKRRLYKAEEDGEPYDVLHFDGHGTLGPPAIGSREGVSQRHGTAEGYLGFVDKSGRAYPVSASDFALILSKAGVPLLLLNACQSGAIPSGVGLEACVATRLLQEGVASVVAMGYSVYAVAAAEFMAVFYEELFRGKFVSEAVVQARSHLRRANLRPSPKGPMPLEDWMVPVHYARREVCFPHLKGSASISTTLLAESLERLRFQATQTETAGEGRGLDEQLRAEGRFFGRDAEFYELERALPAKRVVVVHGVGGTGKTELAKAYARWLRATTGLDDPRLAFFHSFEPGLASFNLDGVLNSFGLSLIGPQFVLDFPTPEDRRNAVMKLLRDHRMLLIWDNFETVHSMPDPDSATPPLVEDELKAIRDFLSEIMRNARGWIMITSRSAEPWLGNEVHRLELEGLKPQNAALYADHLLSPYPKAQGRREQRVYGELLDFLEGHPLSMRLILPHLNRMEPGHILGGLKGEGELPPGFEGEEGRLQSLGASVYYSFRQLAEEHSRWLPALTLFESVVDADVLATLSQRESTPERFRGVSREDWGSTLDACVEAGLLTSLGTGMYRMHPALPAYLMALWRLDAWDAFEEEHESALRECVFAHAVLGLFLRDRISGGNAKTAMAVLDLSWRTFYRMAAEALKSRMFAEAQGILQSLNKFWDARGLYQEARGWVDRCRAILEDNDGNPPDLDTDEGELWLVMASSEASRLIVAGDLDAAEQTCKSLMNSLESSRSEKARPRLAWIYHKLGMVAQPRGNLKDAEKWYKRSLEIEESLGNRPGMASTYHELGIVNQLRGELKDAEKWYKRSLEIKESLGNRPGMAATYHQLGTLAQWRGMLNDAEKWYRMSLEIEESLGDRPHMATTYFQLGIVAQVRGDLNDSEKWHKIALEIRHSLGDRPGIASTYHELGMVAQQRGELKDAEKWYKRSLEIEESLGNRPEVATTYGQLGLLAELSGSISDALDWTVRCVALFDEFPHPATGPGPHHLKRLTEKLGIAELESSWRRCNGKSLPDNIRIFVSEKS